MGSETLWVSAAVLVGSALLTPAARRLARARGLVDVPNARSSHRESTPRGGGAAIAVVTTAAVLFLARRGSLTMALCAAIAVGGLAVAMIGFADDHRPLPSSLRLIVHFGAAIWAVAWLGGLPPLRFGDHVLNLGWTGHAIAVLGIVWVLNLFNFMDGIDGIAASEAVFVVVAGAWLTAGGLVVSDVGTAGLMFAAACGGFLLWNWPPAKIFLGDVGSGYLGYVIAVLALAAARTSPVALWVWLILGGAFFVDATITLMRRTLRGERVYEAHRNRIPVARTALAKSPPGDARPVVPQPAVVVALRRVGGSPPFRCGCGGSGCTRAAGRCCPGRGLRPARGRDRQFRVRKCWNPPPACASRQLCHGSWRPQALSSGHECV